MPDRFFSRAPLDGPRATLDGPEAHHLAHVLRAAPGTAVVLFDGRGAEFDAVVERVGKREVTLSVTARRDVDRELRRDVTLAVALPKGDRQRWLVEKLVELGARRLVPLRTERGVAQPVEQALDRLREAVIQASKQCGRNRLMEVAEAVEWTEYARRPAGADAVRLVAHPGGASLAEFGAVGGLPWPPEATEWIAAVGPEGGFTAAEIDAAAAAGWRAVSLGPRTLRIETAATLLAAWGALGQGG